MVFRTFSQGQRVALSASPLFCLGQDFASSARVSLWPHSMQERSLCLEPHSGADCLGCCRPKPRSMLHLQGSQAGVGGKWRVGAGRCRLESSRKGLKLLSGFGCLTELLGLGPGSLRGPGTRTAVLLQLPGPLQGMGGPRGSRGLEVFTRNMEQLGLVALEPRAHCVSCQLCVFTVLQRPSFCLCHSHLRLVSWGLIWTFVS